MAILYLERVEVRPHYGFDVYYLPVIYEGAYMISIRGWGRMGIN